MNAPARERCDVDTKKGTGSKGSTTDGKAKYIPTENVANNPLTIKIAARNLFLFARTATNHASRRNAPARSKLARPAPHINGTISKVCDAVCFAD